MLGSYPSHIHIDQHSSLQCHFFLLIFSYPYFILAFLRSLQLLLLLAPAPNSFQYCIASVPPLTPPPISAPCCNSWSPNTNYFPSGSPKINDSNVFAMVATKQLTESQLRSLETVERVASCFSLIGAIFIFVTFVVSPNFRRPVNRLIFNASWGNTLGNIATLVSLSGPRAGPTSHLCQFQAFLIQM